MNVSYLSLVNDKLGCFRGSEGMYRYIVLTIKTKRTSAPIAGRRLNKGLSFIANKPRNRVFRILRKVLLFDNL
jgi:hypothetical protein